MATDYSKYYPRMKVEIIEARDLLASDRNGFSDPYVVIEEKVGMYTDKKKYPLKTPVVKKNLNPVWNFSTEVPYNSYFGKIRFLVFDWDRLSSDDFLGSCSVSPSLLNNGVPLDVWLPLEQKPYPKKPMDKGKGPYPTKGELHIRLTPDRICPYCQPGEWFAIQSLVTPDVKPGAEVYHQVVPVSVMNPNPDIPYCDFTVAFGYSGSRHMTTTAIVYNAAGDVVETVNREHGSCFGGLIRWHKNDSSNSAVFPANSYDDLFSLQLQKLPPEISRLVFVVNMQYSNVSLLYGSICLFSDIGYLAVKRVRERGSTDSAMVLCLFQRGSTGRWFFQTVLKPLSVNSIEESKPLISEILSTIPPL